MNNKQKSIRIFLYSSLSQVVTIGFGLVLPRLFLVGYGSEVNGLLNSLSQFLVCLGLFEAGVGAASLQALYRPVALADWDGINAVLAATSRYYKKTGRWYFIALIILSVIYPFVAKCELPYPVICGAVFFSGIGNVVTFYLQGKYNILLQAEGKNYIITNLATIVNILVNLAKVVLIALQVNVVLILAMTFLIQCLQAIYILWYINRNYPKLDLNVEPAYQAIGQKNFVLVHQISRLIFNNTDVLILTVVCGLKVVSVYAMYKMIITHLDQIMTILTNSVVFMLGQTYHTDLNRYKKMVDLIESVYSAVCYAVYGVALFLYLPFMGLYTSGVTDINYMDERLPFLFVAIALLNHSRTPMLWTIDYAGHFKQTMSRSLLESAINLTVSLVGVYFFGIYGVLLGTVIALLYRTNDIIIYSNTKLLGRKPWRTYSIYLVNLVMLVCVSGLFRVLFGGVVIDSYLRLILVGIGTTSLALVLFLLAQVLIFSHCRVPLFGWVKTKMKKA